VTKLGVDEAALARPVVALLVAPAQGRTLAVVWTALVALVALGVAGAAAGGVRAASRWRAVSGTNSSVIQ